MGDGKESQKKPGHGRILIVGDKRKKKKLASLFTLLTHIFFCIFYYFTKPNCWILPGYGYDPVSLLPVMCQFPFPLMILFFFFLFTPCVCHVACLVWPSRGTTRPLWKKGSLFSGKGGKVEEEFGVLRSPLSRFGWSYELGITFVLFPSLSFPSFISRDFLFWREFYRVMCSQVQKNCHGRKCRHCDSGVECFDVTPRMHGTIPTSHAPT